MNREHYDDPQVNPEDGEPEPSPIPLTLDQVVGFIRNLFAGFGLGCAFVAAAIYLGWRL